MPIWVKILKLGLLEMHSPSQRAAAKVRSWLVDCGVISASQDSLLTTSLPHFCTFFWFRKGLEFTLKAFDGLTTIRWKNGLSFCCYQQINNKPGVKKFREIPAAVSSFCYGGGAVAEVTGCSSGPAGGLAKVQMGLG